MRGNNYLLRALILVAACGDHAVDINSTPVIPARLQLDTQAIALPMGRDTTLNIVAYDNYGSTVVQPNITWSSNANSIATVNGSGVVRGISVGTATITATWQNVTTRVNVVVVPPVVNEPEELSLTSQPAFKTIVTLAADEGPLVVLESHLVKSGNERKDYTPIWASEDTTIATVQVRTGLTAYVQGVRRGITKISATVGSIKTTMLVYVFGPGTNTSGLYAIDPHMVEYQESSEGWFYAPMIRLAAGNQSVRIHQIRGTFPGLGRAPPMCTSVTLAVNESVELNGESYGDFALAYFSSSLSRAPIGSTFRMNIDYITASGQPETLTLDLPIRTGTVPSPSSTRLPLWTICWDTSRQNQLLHINGEAVASRVRAVD